MSSARCPITLADLLERHLKRCGYQPADYDLSDVESVQVLGLRIDGRSRAADQLEGVMRAKHCVWGEWDGKIVARRLSSLTATAVPSRDVGVRMLPEGEYPEVWREGEGTLELTRQPARELPFEVTVGYLDVDGDYQPGVQRAVRYTRDDQQESVTVGTTLTMTGSEAAQFAEAELYKLWTQALSGRVTLRRRWLKLAPTDVIDLPTRTGVIPFRVIQQQIHPFGPVGLVLVQHDATVVEQVAEGAPFVPGPVVTYVTQSRFFAFITNALRDEDADSIGFYMTANGASPGIWQGVSVHMSRDNGASYQLAAVLTNGCPYGHAETVLQPGWTTGVWDMGATVEVTMENGTIESTSDAEVLNGANAAMLGEEVIQFVTVTALGNNRFRLSRLLRGRRGTDAYWNAHTAGERFIVLDPLWVERVPVADDLFGRQVLLKAVPAGGQLASTAAVPLAITGLERFPYSPAHLRAVRQPNGDWSLSWIRRTRKGGELTDGVDVPLSESGELYEVDLLDAGGAVLRTLQSITQGTTWTAGMQATDAGSAQSTVRWCVYQMGAYGRGYGSCLTVSVQVAQTLTATAVAAQTGMGTAFLPVTALLVATGVAGPFGVGTAVLTLGSTGGTLLAAAVASTPGVGTTILRGVARLVAVTMASQRGMGTAALVGSGAVTLTATVVAASTGMGAGFLVTPGAGGNMADFSDPDNSQYAAIV